MIRLLVVLGGPEQKRLSTVFCAFWGVGLGWLTPQHTTGFVPIIPKGQEAELMGVFILAGSALSWLPPLIFTVFNERGFSMSYGFASLNIFFALAILVLRNLFDYDRAVEAAQQPSLEGFEEATEMNFEFPGNQSTDDAQYHRPIAKGEQTMIT